MSYTEILEINKDGNVDSYGEIKNAFRGAMAIWDHLSVKYLNEEISPIVGPKRVWGLQNDHRLSKTDLICLYSTFDYGVIRREEIPLLIEAFNDFDGESSLKEQALMIQDLYDSNPDSLGVCFNQTSVNEIWYSDRVITNDDGDKEHALYNINEDNNHFFIFDEKMIKESLK